MVLETGLLNCYVGVIKLDCIHATPTDKSEISSAVSANFSEVQYFNFAPLYSHRLCTDPHQLTFMTQSVDSAIRP